MSRASLSFFRRVPRTLGLSLAAGALLFGATPATAQDTSSPPASVLFRLNPNSRYAIESIIDSARTAGLPTKSLMSTALQGIARKADERKIVDAVRKQLGYLRTAKSVLGAVNDEELVAAAAVLEAGAKPQQLAGFKGRQQGRSDLEAFTVWADFLARGVPKDEASSAITKLWQDGADDAAFHSLWNNVQTDILQGFNPGAALQNRIREGPTRTPTAPGKPPEGPQQNQSSR